MRKVDDGEEKKEKKRREKKGKIMRFIGARRPPEPRPTGTPPARAKSAGQFDPPPKRAAFQRSSFGRSRSGGRLLAMT